MLYQRSLEIEQRLDMALKLIRTGRYSTPRLAEELKVSIPTISRYVTALRERGHDIRAERKCSAWRFILIRPAQGTAKLQEPSPTTKFRPNGLGHAEGT